MVGHSPVLSKLSRHTTFLPIAIFATMITFVFAGWHLVRNEQSLRLDAETIRNAEHVASRLEAFVSTRLAAGQHIQHEWANGEITNYVDFLAQANSAHELFGDFQAINWVDNDGIVRWVTPLKGNEAAQDLNLRKLPIPKLTIAAAERTGRVQVTPPIDLVQGGKGFVAYIPLNKEGSRDGFLNLVFRTAPLINEAFGDGDSSNYHLIITDDGKTVFGSKITTGKNLKEVQKQIRIGDQVWTLSIMPTPATIRSNATFLDELILILGSLFSTLVVFLIRLELLRQNALRNSEERFRDFAESSANWLWEMDEHLRFSYFSERNREITGFEPETYIGKTRRDVAAEGTVDEKWHRHLNDLDNHRLFREFRYEFLRHDGSPMTASISGKPVFDRTGNFCGYRGTGTDITAQQRAEETRDDALREAEQANQAKSEFLATMSHEFRTPLNAILGFSEMLRVQYFGPLGAEKYKEYAADIHDSGAHMLALINDVLDIAAIEAGKRTNVKSEIALDHLIENCLRNMDKAASDNGVNLLMEFPKEIPALYADKRSVTQILQNLISNAIKFSNQNGSIFVSVREATGEIAISVKDDGIGIPPDKLPKITEPFSQADNNPHKAKDGTGLGLSIVKSLVEAHQGNLDIESEVGFGTTVTVSFPS